MPAPPWPSKPVKPGETGGNWWEPGETGTPAPPLARKSLKTGQTGAVKRRIYQIRRGAAAQRRIYQIFWGAAVKRRTCEILRGAAVKICGGRGRVRGFRVMVWQTKSHPDLA